jgi:hypothetical protein
MKSHKATANELVNGLDEFASQLRKFNPQAAKKIERAMFQVMEVEQSLHAAVGEVVQVAFERHGGKGAAQPVLLRRVG